ncbi:complement factor H-like [Seriola lalandi dorsalis]|uniref:complement factor H-like n=1 Tax=Seriola lalandi dorsalis TaxID=1841481 RepID=UPI000C6F9C7F|nr:complement factor H-like [Seriola lalandi dorsalis]
MFPRLFSLHVCICTVQKYFNRTCKTKRGRAIPELQIIPKYCNSWMFIMRLFHHLWLFILWLNMDESLQQDEVNCSVPVIENGYVSGDIREYKRNEVLHFLCNATYNPFRKTPSICSKLGTKVVWDPTPKCELTTCRLSLLPPEGTRYEPPFRNLFSPGESVRVICGGKHNTSEVVTCKDDGEWTFEPTCSAIKCRLSLPPLEGTSYDPPYRNVFPPGERVKITCGDGYYISRPQDVSAVATCKDDGEWTFTPICREVTCNRPRDPTLYDWRNWEPRLKLLDTVRYSCRGGYKRTDGATEATCTRDGWSPNPLCQAPTLEQ